LTTPNSSLRDLQDLRDSLLKALSEGRCWLLVLLLVVPVRIPCKTDRRFRSLTYFLVGSWFDTPIPLVAKNGTCPFLPKSLPSVFPAQKKEGVTVVSSFPPTVKYVRTRLSCLPRFPFPFVNTETRPLSMGFKLPVLAHVPFTNSLGWDFWCARGKSSPFFPFLLIPPARPHRHCLPTLWRSIDEFDSSFPRLPTSGHKLVSPAALKLRRGRRLLCFFFLRNSLRN